MRRFAFLAALAAFTLAPVPDASARTAEQAGVLQAKRRGFDGAQARCFAKVHALYVRQDGRGRWLAPRPASHGGYAYRLELQRSCGSRSERTLSPPQSAGDRCT